MVAVIYTIGIWFRIDIIYIPGYGILYSLDWWALYASVKSQVTFVAYLLAVKPVISGLYECFYLNMLNICANMNFLRRRIEKVPL